MTKPDPRSALVRPAAIAAALFGVAFIWLSLRPSAPVHPDTSRDLAFARDLVDGGALHAYGAWASFAHLAQGTLWIDLLALIELGGFDLGGLEAVLTALLAATVALASLGLRGLLPATEDPWRRELAVVVGSVGLLVAIPLVIEAPILWQPLLLPVPITFAHLSLWRTLRDGALVDALAFAVFAALAIDVHVVSVAFVLPALIALPLACQRPGLATAASLATLAATLALSSRAAFSNNLETASADGWLIPGVVFVLAFLGAGAALRARFVALDWRGRLLAALVVELAVLAAVVVATIPASTPELAGRYVGPFLPIVALALAMLSSWDRGRWTAAVAAAGLALALALAGGSRLWPEQSRLLPVSPRWTIAELTPVGELLAARGLTWTEIVGRVQGPDHANLIGQLSAMLAPGTDDPPPAERGLLIVALDPADAASVRAELPDDPERVASFELDAITALVIDTPGRADRYAAELCSDAGCEGVELAITARVDQAHPNAWAGREVAVFRVRDASPGPLDSVVWRVPVRPGPAVVALLTSTLSERCAWRFIEVDGFEVDAALPSHELELPAGAEGEIFVRRELPVIDPDERGCLEVETLPPSIIELEPRWGRLRELLQPSWARDPG